MATDNIFQQYLRPPKSIMEYSADYDAADARKQDLQQNALTLAANRQKYDEGVQGAQRAAQLRAALSGLSAGATDEDRIKAMRSTGSPEGFAAADGLEKSLGERRKATSAADKDDAETARVKQALDVANHEYHTRLLAQVQTPEQALAWAEEGQRRGVFSQPGQYERGVQAIQQAAADPAKFADWRQRAMQGGQSVTEQMKSQMQQREFDEKVRSARAQEADRDATRAQSARQHSERLNFDRSKQDGDVGPSGAKGGKAPAGYRWTAAGDLEAIPGGPAGNKATSSEGERKAATLLQRLEFSEKQLEDAVTKRPGAAKPDLLANGLRGMGMEAIANTTTGSERQRVDAAQLDILDAALTLGTGAAYTREQLEGYRKSYFPQIGDTPDNVADKQARLKNVIEAAKTQAGRSAPKAKAPPIRVQNDADYAKVPSGAEFITPDGKTRRKP